MTYPPWLAKSLCEAGRSGKRISEDLESRGSPRAEDLEGKALAETGNIFLNS
jgi:hypothetical protein